MDLAIGGLVILILLLPGIFFRKGYYSGEFKIQYISNDFFSLLTNTLIPSILLYLISSPVIWCFGYSYDLGTLLKVLSTQESLVREGIAQISRLQTELFIFHLSLNSFAFFLGISVRKIVISRSIDTKYSFFQFQNIWHYLISARFFHIKGLLSKDCPEDVDLTFVEATVTLDDQSFLISGELIDYQLGKDGSLDLLIISKARRKRITHDNSQDHEDIQGNLFILKYANLHSISFSFFQIEVLIDDTGQQKTYQLRLIE